MLDKMLSDRGVVEKVIEQELSGRLFQAMKLARKEEKPLVEDTLQVILRIIAACRSEREKVKATEVDIG
jgi:hypothetical protein